MESPKNQQGVALLEVAISIFILGVGLLGLASLQFMSLKNMQLSQTSNLANTHLQQIAEVMRENRNSLASYAREGAIEGEQDITCETQCTQEQSADNALNRIQNEIFNIFDNPSLTIKPETLASYTVEETVLDDDGNPQIEEVKKTINIYTLTLQWEETGDFILKDDDTANKIQTMRVVL